jgi:hypothetical protein
MLDYFGGWKGKRKGVEREGRVEGALKGRGREGEGRGRKEKRKMEGRKRQRN